MPVSPGSALDELSRAGGAPCQLGLRLASAGWRSVVAVRRRGGPGVPATLAQLDIPTLPFRIGPPVASFLRKQSSVRGVDGAIRGLGGLAPLAGIGALARVRAGRAGSRSNQAERRRRRQPRSGVLVPP